MNLLLFSPTLNQIEFNRSKCQCGRDTRMCELNLKLENHILTSDQCLYWCRCRQQQNATAGVLKACMKFNS